MDPVLGFALFIGALGVVGRCLEFSVFFGELGHEFVALQFTLQ